MITGANHAGILPSGAPARTDPCTARGTYASRRPVFGTRGEA